MRIKVICCLLIMSSMVAHTQFKKLTTPKPMAETQAMYDFLCDQFGKKTLSGVMTIRGLNDTIDEYQNEAFFVEKKTGKKPVVLGLDFMDELESVKNNPQVVEDATNWYHQNGIPVFCWHWRDPSRKTHQFYSPSIDKGEFTTFDVSNITNPKSLEYKAMLADIDQVAERLKQLQKRHIPIIWRPLHEASGGWFWWGYKGPEYTKTLWKLMYDRMVNHHKLNNLIWVWTSDAKDNALEWYPGDKYVDIIGMDIYAQDHSHESQVSNFNSMKKLFGSEMLIALSECGSLPLAENIQKDGAYWSWVMPWHGYYTKDAAPNPVEVWKSFLNSETVITLDEMPDLKHYSSKRSFYK